MPAKASFFWPFQVDLGLTIPRFLIGNGEFERLTDVSCATEVPLGLNVMVCWLFLYV